MNGLTAPATVSLAFWVSFACNIVTQRSGAGLVSCAGSSHHQWHHSYMHWINSHPSSQPQSQLQTHVLGSLTANPFHCVHVTVRAEKFCLRLQPRVATSNDAIPNYSQRASATPTSTPRRRTYSNSNQSHQSPDLFHLPHSSITGTSLQRGMGRFPVQQET